MIRKRARITRQMNASFSARGMTPKMTITECGKITPLREGRRGRRILTCAAERKRTRSASSRQKKPWSEGQKPFSRRRLSRRDSIFDNLVFTAAWAAQADGPRGLICASHVSKALMTILNWWKLISHHAAKRSLHYRRLLFAFSDTPPLYDCNSILSILAKCKF